LFEITIETQFSASHQLNFRSIGPEALHLHNWQVKVAVCRETLNSDGLVMDFHLLKAKTDEIIGIFSGKNIETLPQFQDINASAENIAKYIYDRLEIYLPTDVKLSFVEVTEACSCVARYSNCRLS